MQLAKYSTERGAARYAADLARHFPKRQFKACSHPYDFAWTVAMYADGEFISYVGKRKPAHYWAEAV
jgi:hypothetical protein